MKTKSILFVATLLIMLFNRCGLGKFSDHADKQFGDQHFKTAISLIELYKIRYGVYPPSLDSIKYTGDWDAIAVGAVSYKRLDTGYELDLVRGWIAKPDSLNYPDDFWQGLGLVKSNIKRK